MVRPDATLCVVALAVAVTGIFDPLTASAQQASGSAESGSESAAPALNYATARLERRLMAVRSSGPIALDGNLNEPAWNNAPVASRFVQNDPREGEPATFDTEVRVLYDDDDALYFGVFAIDDET
ncbi:MAG: hypothetical protein ACRD3C_25240 [Vicinamibacterales bacterium]